MRRPRDAPAEAALDRADVDDAFAPRYASRVVLPRRDPLEDRVEDVAQPDDRVLLALPSLNAVWTKGPHVEIRSQSEPKCPRTTFDSVGSPRTHMSATPPCATR